MKSGAQEDFHNHNKPAALCPSKRFTNSSFIIMGLAGKSRSGTLPASRLTRFPVHSDLIFHQPGAPSARVPDRLNAPVTLELDASFRWAPIRYALFALRVRNNFAAP
jgi:hypothetical protein